MNQNPPTQNNYNSIPGYDLATDIPPLPQENKAPQAGYTNDPNNQFHTFNLPNTPSKKGRSRRKIIATILGILLLVFGMGTGVYLSQRTQDIREKAARQPGKCDDFDYGLCNPDGTCRKKGMCMGCCRGKPSTPAPNSTRPDICSSATVNKKTLKPGETITISSTSKEDVNYFMYAVYNMDNLYGPDNPKPVCVKDGGDITTAQDICPAGSHLLIFEDPNKELRKSGSRTLRYEELFVKDELTGKTVSNLSITAYFQKEGEPISVPKPECVVRTISSQEQGQTECLDSKSLRQRRRKLDIA